jgi:predicted kinase
MIIVVSGLPAAGKTTLARGLAAELSRPLFSLDAIKEALHDAPGSQRDPKQLRCAAEAVLAALLADAPSGAVVDIWLDPTRDDRERLRSALPAGAASCEVVCDVTAETASRRYASRQRHSLHRGLDGELLRRIERAAHLLAVGGSAEPSGLGPVRRVDTSGEVAVPEIAAWVRTLIGSRARQ